jgi:hypothetical protein
MLLKKPKKKRILNYYALVTEASSKVHLDFLAKVGVALAVLSN